MSDKVGVGIDSLRPLFPHTLIQQLRKSRRLQQYLEQFAKRDRGRVYCLVSEILSFDDVRLHALSQHTQIKSVQDTNKERVCIQSIFESESDEDAEHLALFKGSSTCNQQR